MKSVKIGFAPTRRSIFSAPDAVKYANLTRERLKELGVEFVDITDINEEGLFYDEADREKIQEKFRRENVKGIFFPHGNFGTEYVCAILAKEMGRRKNIPRRNRGRRSQILHFGHVPLPVGRGSAHRTPRRLHGVGHLGAL